MIVFFENGSIADKELHINAIKIDAGNGYNACRKELNRIRNTLPFNTVVYTNSLDAFSNFWCWDEEKKMPMIYIRDENDYNEWKLISEMTDRQLRIAHNLEKMYVNGIFTKNIEP